jgi:polar amino acid transport system substrate-binding protein
LLLPGPGAAYYIDMRKTMGFVTVLAAWVMAAGLLVMSAGCGSGETDTWAKITHSGTWQIGTDATYPPFETVDTKTGEVVGFDIDLINAICAKYDGRPEFIVTPFDGIVPGLTTEKYDAIISAFTITPERATRVLFSDPYYDAGQMIAVPLTDSVTTTLEDLEGLRLGCQLGTTGERMAHRVPGAEIFSYENIGAAFIDMENGRLDAVVNDEPTSRIIIAERKTAKLVGKRLSDEQYGIAVRPSDSVLVMKINTALIILNEDGTIASLKKKWFGGAE